MARQKLPVINLTDEQLLKEFMKRFACDGAVFIYLDAKNEYAFGKWSNGTGKNWVKSVFTAVKNEVFLEPDTSRTKEFVHTKLSEQIKNNYERSRQKQPL